MCKACNTANERKQGLSVATPCDRCGSGKLVRAERDRIAEDQRGVKIYRIEGASWQLVDGKFKRTRK